MSHEQQIASVMGLDVLELRPLGGGACQDNFSLRVREGAGERRFALRSDAAMSLPGSIGREQEFPVIQAAVAAGVPTPAVSSLRQGVIREGAWCYLMDWAEGEAIGSKVVKKPELARARQRLPEQLARALAAVHSVTPDQVELPIQRTAPEVAVADLYALLDSLGEARPELELALRWARDHLPSEAETTLVHGDFRTGNFLVDEGGLVALLDWEFARWGDPHEDLAWLCVRDWRFGQIKQTAGGITTRGDLAARYSAASGRAVDPVRLHWWEGVGNLRWGIGAVVQGQRYLKGKTWDLEMLAIPRRSAEMAYEALRLIEAGPDGLGPDPLTPPTQEAR